MSTDEVRQVIGEGNRRFGEAAARKDYTGMAALYTEDAKLLPPDAPITIDNELIDQLIERSIDDYEPRYGGFGAAPKFNEVTLAGTP